MPDPTANPVSSPANALQANLQEHVRNICGLRHGTDNYDELEQKAQYVESFFRYCGFPVENQYFQFRSRQYRNVIATVAGSRPDLPPLLLGAHYDGNRGTPGADDNASGVAVLLETARALKQAAPARRVELVAFTLEEPQTFTHLICRGSKVFARRARERKERYQGAVILECIGFTSEKQKWELISQLLGLEIPPTGDFLAVVGNVPSHSFLNAFVASARRSNPALKTIGYAAPAQGYLLPQLRFSDHSSFWDNDYPAIMLNDTVMFRNPNYHQPGDLPETLDFPFMAEVAASVVTFLKDYR